MWRTLQCAYNQMSWASRLNARALLTSVYCGTTLPSRSRVYATPYTVRGYTVIYSIPSHSHIPRQYEADRVYEETLDLDVHGE